MPVHSYHEQKSKLHFVLNQYSHNEITQLNFFIKGHKDKNYV